MRTLLFLFLISTLLLSCSKIANNPKTETQKAAILCDEAKAVCTTETSKSTITQLTQENMTIEDQDKPKLIYYFDPLCGWCYGFGPVMSQLEEEFKDKVDIEVVSGGLFLGGRAGLVNEVAPHIRAGAYKSVESRTGVKFGDSFIADVMGEGKTTLNSLWPSIALCIVREKFPEKELEFAKMLLNAVYWDGMDTVDMEAYADYAKKIGFDPEEFNAKMKDIQYRKKAEQEFERFRQSRFSAMPAVVLETADGETPLSKGYVTYNELKSKLSHYIE